MRSFCPGLSAPPLSLCGCAHAHKLALSFCACCCVCCWCWSRVEKSCQSFFSGAVWERRECARIFLLLAWRVNDLKVAMGGREGENSQSGLAPLPSKQSCGCLCFALHTHAFASRIHLAVCCFLGWVGAQQEGGEARARVQCVLYAAQQDPTLPRFERERKRERAKLGP